MEASPPESVPGTFPLVWFPQWSGGVGTLYDLSPTPDTDDAPERPEPRPIGFIHFKDPAE